MSVTGLRLSVRTKSLRPTNRYSKNAFKDARNLPRLTNKNLKNAFKDARNLPRLTNKNLKNGSKLITNLSSKSFKIALKISWVEDWKRYGLKITNSLRRCKKQ